MNGKIVIISGFFNPLHIGHIRYIEEAKKLGDFLVVIVNNDEQVRLKGSVRFMPEQERMEIMKSLKYVDDVFLSIDNYKDGKEVPISKSLEALAQKYPGELIFAKGGDRHQGNTPEAETCRKLNIKFIDNVGGGKIQSSSWLLDNVIKFKKDK